MTGAQKAIGCYVVVVLFVWAGVAMLLFHFIRKFW